MVTIVDFVEEIVGELGEEDRRQVPEVVRVGADTLPLRGRVGLEIPEAMLEIELGRERRGESTTLAGLLYHVAGHVPKPGKVADSDGLRLEILKANQRKVLRLRARRISSGSSQDTRGA